jgi:hypothetical protein
MAASFPSEKKNSFRFLVDRQIRASTAKFSVPSVLEASFENYKEFHSTSNIGGGTKRFFFFSSLFVQFFCRIVLTSYDYLDVFSRSPHATQILLNFR